MFLCDISVFYSVPMEMAPLNMGGDTTEACQASKSSFLYRFTVFTVFHNTVNILLFRFELFKHCLVLCLLFSNCGFLCLGLVLCLVCLVCWCLDRPQPVVSLGDRDPQEWVNWPYPASSSSSSSSPSSFLLFPQDGLVLKEGCSSVEVKSGWRNKVFSLWYFNAVVLCARHQDKGTCCKLNNMLWIYKLYIYSIYVQFINPQHIAH